MLNVLAVLFYVFISYRFGFYMAGTVGLEACHFQHLSAAKNLYCNSMIFFMLGIFAFTSVLVSLNHLFLSWKFRFDGELGQ